MRSVEFIHPVEELLRNVNYIIIDKSEKYAAPPILLFMLHNAMELMLRDFFLMKNIKEAEKWRATQLIDQAEQKLTYVKRNKLRLKKLNSVRNMIYHKTSLLPRIESLKDYYELVIGLYKSIYKKRFTPPLPTKIRIAIAIGLYSILLAYSSFPIVSLFNFVLLSASIFIGITAFFYFISYLLKQTKLNKAFFIKL